MDSRRTAVRLPGRPQPSAVLERVSDALVALDRNWRYTYVNSQAAALFGRTPDELLGRHIWTEFPEGIGQPFHLAYEKAMADQVVTEIESYYEPWDRWFENRIYPSADGLSIFFHEITERKRAEREARDNAALLEGQNRALESIARGEPLERTLDLLLRVIEALCPEMVCSILLEEAGRVCHAAAPSLPRALADGLEADADVSCVSSFAARAVRGDAIVIATIPADPLWAGDCGRIARDLGFRTAWCSPIRDAQRGVLGAFAVYFRNALQPSDRHRYLIDAASHTAAAALVSHRAAEERKVSEERLRLAVTGGNVGLWEWDVVGNRMGCSAELQSMLGWPPGHGEVTLERFIDAIHVDDRTRVELGLHRSVALGVDYDVEYRVVRPDGSVRWVTAKGSGEYDGGSTLVRMVGVALDITGRREAEEDLRTSEERFQLVARATNDAVWDWDIATDAVWWNQGLTAQFGYAAEEAGRERGWRHAHIHPEDLGAVLAGIGQVTARGERFWSGEFRFRRHDGSYADVLDRGFVVYDAASRAVRMIGAMTDITERKRALERLEEAVAARTAQVHAQNRQLEDEVARRQLVGELLRRRNEELKAFAYTVSHDLKAPLRGIAGYAHELSRRHATGLDERGRLCVDRILTATGNLDQLIEDLLHYARLDAETPTPMTLDLTRIVDEILHDRRGATAEMGVEVTVDLGVSRVHAWGRGLTQALTNLIDNALKYSRRSTPPRVAITSEPLGDGVRITVEDNGIGFDVKYHDRIFGLFNRLVRHEEFEGTGAGLAIVKKLVDKMGGTVHADSTPGGGARFFLDLPPGSRRDV